MVKLIDCFIFYNELDLLVYRLNILKDIVDYFIIVEATHTFSGHPKPLYFNDNKHLFDKIREKIIYILVDDLPHTYHNAFWDNEHHQRNSISRGINTLTLKDDDIIMISDLDEMPDPQTLTQIKMGKISITINALEMDFYYYNLNCKHTAKWTNAKAISYLNYTQLNISCENIRHYVCPAIRRGGWHLSYFGNSSFIKQKIEAFSHQEFNNGYFTDTNRIDRIIQTCYDLFDRDSEEKRYISIKDNTYLPHKYEIYLTKYIVEKG